MGPEIAALTFTSGWASGINAYAAVLVLGLLGRFAGAEAVPAALMRTDVLVVAGILFLIEMVADKIPYIDSTWDSIHTLIRPAVGGVLGYLLAHDTASVPTALAATAGALTALTSHTAKAGTRLGVNASPEPVSNIVVSTAEDLTVAGVLSLALAQPMIAAGIAGTLLLVTIAIAFLLISRVRRLHRRLAHWRGGRLWAPAAPQGEYLHD
ncbi:DUF4126 domain-containing protein [Gephyromycinifex aptenodytis]|uniref:DUF4126 domain-containing protein n=1 Tax=Gephyromycinifex aptenodytis TaxID=2716227 RepID=UPI001B2FF6DB|nr:DUF4126 domain-containing protein [Gephyromycinifex aptenodytis]